MKLPFRCLSCCSAISSEAAASAMVRTGNGGQNHEAFQVFSYNELRNATQDFSSSNKIGEGSFGPVYKGRLRDGTVVGVKVLSVELESMRGEREFASELAALSTIKHQNLVTLRGCCIDGARRYLVYEYMENNSLARGEQNRMKFNWEIRREIALGIARGLAYLHEEVKPRIVHRDIKASNVLIDHNFMPKISDFGLSKLLRDNGSHISTRVAGTFGRPVVSFNLEQGEHYLVQKAWEVYEDRNLGRLVDPTLEMNYPEEEAVRFLKVGLLCVQENVRLRPSMSTATKMLNNEIDIQDAEISQPGLLSNFMDIKLGQQNMSS
ncbi:hypothetical protein KPL71_017666 [Citrus sinensis]|uniref:Uncharacterized protein n=1 Tax=Citrus sinensis TaxID=2711 RepID=A0ACB8JS41_CITSI|nr:hypothetical protein KPL71_017666 [Citrus sinensis]